MKCEKCGAVTEYGRDFLFYGGKDLGDHKIQMQKANTIFTYEVHNKGYSDILNIAICNRCLSGVFFMRTADWLLGIGSVLLIPAVIFFLIGSQWDKLPIYWVSLIFLGPFFIFMLFYWIRSKIRQNRFRNMNDSELDNVIKTRETSSHWQIQANQNAISAYFAKTKTKVWKLNGMGWGINDDQKNQGCDLGYVYLTSKQYKTEINVEPPPARKYLTNEQRAQIDESWKTQFYKDSAQAWVNGRINQFLDKKLNEKNLTVKSLIDMFATNESYQPADGNAVYYFFATCSQLPDEFLVLVLFSLLLTNKRLIIKHGKPASFSEINMSDVASCDLKEAKKGTLKLVMKSGEMCVLTDCPAYHKHLDKLVKKGVFTP